MSNPQRLNPLSDVVFSKLFEDMSSAQAMLEIINAVLTDAGDEPIAEITHLSSQYPLAGKHIGERGGRLDVKAKAANGNLFDIEVQLTTAMYMNDRALFYGSQMMLGDFKEAMPYTDMPNVRVICIADFTLRKDHPDFLQPIGVYYRKPPFECASEKYRSYNVELPKFREQCKTLIQAEGKPLWQWLYLLSSGYQNSNDLKELESMSEGMRVFAEKYRLAMNDPQLRDLYEMDLSAARERLTREDVARTEGREEGWMSARIDMAQRMLNAHLQLDQIAMVTGLSVEEILEL